MAMEGWVVLLLRKYWQRSSKVLILQVCLLASKKNKSTYYEEIKKAQRSLEVTDWLVYSIEVLIQGLKETVLVVQFVRKKTEFYDRYNSELNERQRKVINKMFNQGVSGFEGGMTAKKYVSINKTTKNEIKITNEPINCFNRLIILCIFEPNN